MARSRTKRGRKGKATKAAKDHECVCGRVFTKQGITQHLNHPSNEQCRNRANKLLNVLDKAQALDPGAIKEANAVYMQQLLLRPGGIRGGELRNAVANELLDYQEDNQGQISQASDGQQMESSSSESEELEQQAEAALLPFDMEIEIPEGHEEQEEQRQEHSPIFWEFVEDFKEYCSKRPRKTLPRSPERQLQEPSCIT